MPLDAKKFAKIDKEWGRLMNRAHATKVVVQAASNDALRTTLPMLFNELERCQKSLEGYLEAKRRRFPRFYFLSNPVLLQILSQGSNPLSIQPYYEKIFDAIDKVVHDPSNRSIISKFMTIFGDASEVITFYEDVKAEGNIEDWYVDLQI
ncbi:DNAH5 [Symbiodinium sp. KB8]|nr:DNAH5 [Symbiodinium sp. KB8]